MNSSGFYQMQTWLSVDRRSEFPIQNIPFGIFKPKNRLHPRAGTRIGNFIIDLSVIASRGYLADAGVPSEEVFSRPTLNDFMAMGKPVWQAVRNKLISIFNAENEEIWNTPDFCEHLLFRVKDVEMLMPVEVGDYTDFYSSIEHATNVGKMFRDPQNPLLPNWKHIPIGYHGRASSIVVSGTGIHRPVGQIKSAEAVNPLLAPTQMLDFELEMAFITGHSTELGTRIPVHRAEEYIFGLVLFNDLSARDIQKWEYIPLGPFVSKNFGSVISPWIVTLDALEPFRVEGPEQIPEPLPYLRYEGKGNYDINLEVWLKTDNSDPIKICTTNYKYMYWNMFQQLAHQTVTGCNINIGDMYASGTISGPAPDSYGSLLELTWNGTRPIELPDGSQRTFLEDYDTIIFKGWAEKNGLRIGFGECVTQILPALPHHS